MRTWKKTRYTEEPIAFEFSLQQAGGGTPLADVYRQVLTKKFAAVAVIPLA